MDISPVETTSSSNFPNYVTAMRAVDMTNEASLSGARKLADERLRSVIQVMHASPCVVLWADKEWQPQASHRAPHPTIAGPPTEHEHTAVPAHQPGGGGWALHVEAELGCLG